VQNGVQSGKKFTTEATREHWKTLIQETLPARAVKWHRLSARKRRWFYCKQHFFCLLQYYFRKKLF